MTDSPTAKKTFHRKLLSSPRLTSWVRFVLDDCVPARLRDRRWLYRGILRVLNRKMDVDFKVKAPLMSDPEFRRSYEAIMPMRDTDMTPAALEFVFAHLKGRTVLDAGCGNGEAAGACQKKGFRVVALDLVAANLTGLKAAPVVANLETLPFADKSFDTVICLHTLEHVRNAYGAIRELKRVTRSSLILVVPREKYFRYTANYHLHFFSRPEVLLRALRLKNAECKVIDGALCYCADLEGEKV